MKQHVLKQLGCAGGSLPQSLLASALKAEALVGKITQCVCDSSSAAGPAGGWALPAATCRPSCRTPTGVPQACRHTHDHSLTS